METFETLFCIDPSAPKAAKPTSAPSAARKGFLESNRARTIGIIAMKFERQYSAVPKLELPAAFHRAIKNAESVISGGQPLSLEEIEAFLSITPSPEEVRELSKVDSTMGWEEQFLAGVFGPSQHVPLWLDSQAFVWRWLGCSVASCSTAVSFFV
jgi:hypothetical protein